LLKWILPDLNEQFTNYLDVVQQQNLKLNQLLLAANSEEWNDDELDLYERIFSAKEQMPQSVWMPVCALKLN